MLQRGALPLQAGGVCAQQRHSVLGLRRGTARGLQGVPGQYPDMFTCYLHNKCLNIFEQIFFFQFFFSSVQIYVKDAESAASK